MNRPLRPLLPAAFVALFGLAPFAASELSALDIPPPTDRELTQFLAVQKELVAHPSRATELC